MDNYQPTIDRFDSSSELNRTWYFERFSSILSEEPASSSEAFTNQSKLFANLNNDHSNSEPVTKLVANGLENLDTSVYTHLFESKELISSTYDELTNLSNVNRVQEDTNSLLFFNTTIQSLNNVSSLTNHSSMDSNHSTSLRIQSAPSDENSLEDGQVFSQLFFTNLSSIQNLINDQMYFMLNSSNTTSLTNATFYNSTTFIQTIDDRFNATSTQPQPPHYNWIYIIVIFLIIFGVLGN